MAESPADAAFAAEWRSVTEQLFRDQIEELTAELSWVEAVARVTLKVRSFSDEHLEELDARVGGVALSRTQPVPWPDDALTAIAMLAQWAPGRWPDAPAGLPTLQQLHEIDEELGHLDMAFWRAQD